MDHKSRACHERDSEARDNLEEIRRPVAVRIAIFNNKIGFPARMINSPASFEDFFIPKNNSDIDHSRLGRIG
jgi:hypothetical protein